MGSLGFPELLVIGVIALLLFSPKRLPDAGKALGHAIRGFKSAFEGRDDARPAAEVLPGGRTCSACAQPAEADAAFCRHCGRALSAAPKPGAS